MGIVDPFAKLGNAPAPGGSSPKWRRGAYSMEVMTFGLKESKNPAYKGELMVVCEATVTARHSPVYDNSNEVGERVGCVFTFQRSGWAGQFAMSNLRAIIAAMFDVDFDIVDGSHALKLCGCEKQPDGSYSMGDGTKAAGQVFDVIVTDSDKSDDSGKVYTDKAYLPFGAIAASAE